MTDPRRLDRIKLALFDVDGVLTDGTLFIGKDGEVVKPFNAKDGFGVALLQNYGIKVGVLSGKDSEALRYRCQQLKFDTVVLGSKDKLADLGKILKSLGINRDGVAFAGDDVNDLAVMKASAYSYAPKDAHPLVVTQANTVCESFGGRGVLREVAEHILLQRGYGLAEIYSEFLVSLGDAEYVQ